MLNVYVDREPLNFIVSDDERFCFVSLNKSRTGVSGWVLNQSDATPMTHREALDLIAELRRHGCTDTQLINTTISAGGGK